MNLTLKAFYYLAIQLYITTAFYSSINRTNELRQFFQLLEENILQRRRELIGFQRKRLFLVFWIFLFHLFRQSNSIWTIGLLNSIPISGQGAVSAKYYTKADKYYSTLFWAYLVLSVLTLSTMVIPAIIVTIRSYFTFDVMTKEQWIIPFYIEYFLKSFHSWYFWNRKVLFFIRRIPFELNTFWKYLVVITLSALSIYGVALGKIIIHELYYRGGFQIIACTIDLSTEIKETTSIIYK